MSAVAAASLGLRRAGDLAMRGTLTIGGLVAIAGLCSRAAEMLASEPTFPAAHMLASADRRDGRFDSDGLRGEVRM